MFLKVDENIYLNADNYDRIWFEPAAINKWKSIKIMVSLDGSVEEYYVLPCEFFRTNEGKEVVDEALELAEKTLEHHMKADSTFCDLYTLMVEKYEQPSKKKKH